MAHAAARTLTLALRGPLAREDLPKLAAGLGRRLDATRPKLALIDVEDLAADTVSLEALALIALRARRAGCRIRLHNCPPGLRELVELAGFGELF